MPLVTYLFVTATVTSLPVIVVAMLARDRIGRSAGSGLVASSFAASTAYRLWRLDWFDVWRHGAPPVTDLINYVPWVVVMGAAGWLIGSALLRRSRGATVTS